MLRTYGRQLNCARRLARFKRTLAAAEAEDEVEISRLARRRVLVEQVAREIVENLMASGSTNQTVQEIRSALESEFGDTLELTYPPAEADMRIYRQTNEGPIEVSIEERNAIIKRLWEITLEKVDDTML
nr:DVU0524 family FlgM-associated protein [Desulfobaculum xiamenense]